MKLNFFGRFLFTANKAMVMNYAECEVETEKKSDRSDEDLIFYWAFCMLPTVFPAEWLMSNYKPIHHKHSAPLQNSVMNYFNLSNEEFRHLFTVWQQSPEKYGGVMLHFDADAWELGANILWFVKNKMIKN